MTSAVKKTATHVPVWQDSAHMATGLTSIMTAGVHADRASKVRALAKQERLLRGAPLFTALLEENTSWRYAQY